METKSWLPLLVVTLCLYACFFGTYKLGRVLERRDLKEALETELGNAYYEGLADGKKQGYKKGLSSCDDLVDSLNSDRRR
jgi:hypothetical protein